MDWKEFEATARQRLGVHFGGKPCKLDRPGVCAPKPAQQVRQARFQALGNLFDVHQRNIVYPALNAGVVCPVQAATLRCVFLNLMRNCRRCILLISSRAAARLSVALLALFMVAAPSAQTQGIDSAVLAKANAGDAAAQYQVGWYYEHPNAIWGNGYTESGSSPHDYVQAAFWYRKAAEQGNADAQYDLGDSYLFGHGVPVDYAQGIMWLRKAAEQGYRKRLAIPL